MKRLLRGSLWALLVSAGVAAADVKPHALFTEHMVLQRDMKVAVWGAAAAGEKVTVRFRDQEASTVAENGGWRVEIGPFQAGGPDTLTIEGKNRIEIRDVLVGEVWVASGQSNMEWPLIASHEGKQAVSQAMIDKVRLFMVPNLVQPKPIANVNAKWTTCNPTDARNFSAVAYYFGRKLSAELGVPVGLIDSTWGGTPAQAWTSRDFMESNPRLNAEILAPFEKYVENFKPAPPPKDGDGKKKGKKAPQSAWGPNSPASLYNGMIAPIEKYRIRGAIWYQGESNAGQADQYRVLFPRMIECWRAKWGQGDFPFFFVQLAPWQPGGNWAELRESQRETDHKVPHTAMAVITDYGDAKDIHPQKKQPVGELLAAAALEDVYGKQVVGHSPDYKSMKIDGDAIVLEFDHVGGGLEARGGSLIGFTVCGPDKKFVPATAELKGNTVVVRAAGVAEPKAVRFGWTNMAEGNLFNKEGFPATPFRTDDFPFVTAPKK